MPDDPFNDASNNNIQRQLGILIGKTDAQTAQITDISDDVKEIKESNRKDLADLKNAMSDRLDKHDVQILELQRSHSKASGGLYTLWLIGSGVFVLFSEWLLKKIGWA